MYLFEGALSWIDPLLLMEEIRLTTWDVKSLVNTGISCLISSINSIVSCYYLSLSLFDYVAFACTFHHWNLFFLDVHSFVLGVYMLA